MSNNTKNQEVKLNISKKIFLTKKTYVKFIKV
jgi:hypothetical protein